MGDDDRPTAPPAVSRSDEGDPFGALAPGTKIGKYQIAEMLGQGGFGLTYRARDTQLDRDVAIKEYLPTAFARRMGGNTVVPRSTQTAEDFLWGRSRFLDEAKTLARLEDAPGIVNVYDFMEANGTAYMVMALVRGETLEGRLKRDRRLQQPAIELLIYPLLDGLEVVHEAGFLHRDIKPANILLDGAGRPTLIDFGASRLALQGRTQAMTAVYTPGYAAPEQMTPSAKQGPWTDIYALAGTLYHCVTGQTPLSAIERLTGDALVPATEAGKGRYGPSLLAAIDVGLRLKAPDRPQSIADWRRALAGIADRPVDTPTREMNDPTRPMEGDLTRRVASGGRRTSRLWIAAGIAALIAAGGGGVWLALRPPPETIAEALRRADEEARRHTEIAAKLRQQEEDRQRAAAEAARRAEQEAARKAAEEKAATEDAARRRTDEAERQRAAAEAARRQADEEVARKAAEERAAVEAVARRKAEEAAAERAAAAAAQRRTEEQARAEAEARRKVEADAAARKAAEEREAAEAAAKRKAEEEARARAEQDASARKAAEEKAAAEAAEKRRRDEEARAKAEADAAARRRDEEQRRAAEETTRAELAARERARDEARRQAEEEARKAAEDKGKTEADARRQAEAGEAALRLSELDRKRIQVALTALGHDTRGSDGAFGSRTRQMIAAWQKKQSAPDTGYLTVPQLAALRQQAAPAIAKYDDEQKKLDDDKRKAEEEATRKQEDDAKRRADEERRQAGSTQPAAAPAATGGVDGVYVGEFCQGRQLRCVPASLTVRANEARMDWSIDRCKARGSMSVRIDAAGKIVGSTSGFQNDCTPAAGRVWGSISGGSMSIEGTWTGSDRVGGGDSIRASFTRGGAPLPAPQEPPRPSTPTPPSVATAPSVTPTGPDGQWTGRLYCENGPTPNLVITLASGSGKTAFTTRFGPGHVQVSLSGTSVSGEVAFTGYSGGTWSGPLRGALDGTRLTASASTRGSGVSTPVLCSVTLSR